MIVLVTDFGPYGPYLGQMRSVLAHHAPAVPVIDLLNNAPAFDPIASAHLLAALLVELPRRCTVLGIIDPGVGTDRRPVAVRVDDRWLVGPDNGLFEVAAARADAAAWHTIDWRPETLSVSFHGRDLFAPVAAALATDTLAADWLRPIENSATSEPDERPAVIYIDAYGNCMTGLRAANLAADTRLIAGARECHYAATFGAVPEGASFWYTNSLELAEIAVNRGSAADKLGLAVGDAVEIR